MINEQLLKGRSISEVRRNLRHIRQQYNGGKSIVWMTEELPCDPEFTVERMCLAFNWNKWRKRSAERCFKAAQK